MRIVGQLVCGPGEADRYLKETLEEFKRLCDDVVVCLCNATEKEAALVSQYDFRSYKDDREWGRFQPDIKTRLLQTILLLEPDYILVLDADETVPTLTREGLEELSVGRDSCYFYVVNLWNDERHYSNALSFWNVRAYRPRATPDTQFLRKPLHCGNAPPYFYSLPARVSYTPHLLVHRGLMDPRDRARKVERYAKYDPHAIHKGQEFYDALAAPGSGSVYNQEDVLNQIKEYVARL